MKAKIHPAYSEILVRCVTCQNEFITRSTRLDLQKTTREGQEMPVMTVEICSNCHPFYTGKQMLMDTAGRVEKFMRRYKKTGGANEPGAAE